MEIKIERRSGNETAVWKWNVKESDELVEKIRLLAYEAAGKDQREAKKYKGAMLIHCETCGEDHAFTIPYRTKKHKCRCGATQELEGLARARFRCPECGINYEYWTNLTEEHIQCSCIGCQSRMDAVWSDEEDLFLPE